MIYLLNPYNIKIYYTDVVTDKDTDKVTNTDKVMDKVTDKDTDKVTNTDKVMDKVMDKVTDKVTDNARYTKMYILEDVYMDIIEYVGFDPRFYNWVEDEFNSSNYTDNYYIFLEKILEYFGSFKYKLYTSNRLIRTGFRKSKYITTYREELVNTNSSYLLSHMIITEDDSFGTSLDIDYFINHQYYNIGVAFYGLQDILSDDDIDGYTIYQHKTYISDTSDYDEPIDSECNYINNDYINDNIIVENSDNDNDSDSDSGNDNIIIKNRDSDNIVVENRGSDNDYIAIKNISGYNLNNIDVKYKDKNMDVFLSVLKKFFAIGLHKYKPYDMTILERPKEYEEMEITFNEWRSLRW